MNPMNPRDTYRAEIARDIVVAILGSSGKVVSGGPMEKLGGTACEVLRDFLKPEKETAQ